jgi:hypothetical protein
MPRFGRRVSGRGLVQQPALLREGGGAVVLAGVGQRLEQRASGASVEGVGLDGGLQVRECFGEAAGAGQGAAESGAAGGQVGAFQDGLVVMDEVAGGLRQQHVQAPAQQRSLGLLLALGLADVGPGGAFPLDAEEVVGGWEMGREQGIGVERFVEGGQQATGPRRPGWFAAGRTGLRRG